MLPDHDSLHEELDALGSAIPSPRAIGAPEGYFDRLPDQLLSRWRKEQRQVRRIRNLRLSLAAAAILSAFAFLWWGLGVGQQPEDALAGITSEDAYAYVMDHLDEFAELIPEQVAWPEPGEGVMGLDDVSDTVILESMTADEIESLF